MRLGGVTLREARGRRTRGAAGWATFAAAAAVPLWLGLVKALVWPPATGWLLPLAMLLAFKGYVLALVARGRPRPVEIDLAPGGLMVIESDRGRETITAAEVEAAYPLPSGSVCVRLGKGRDLLLDGVEDPDAVLQHLGFGARGRATTFTVRHAPGDHPLARPASAATLVLTLLGGLCAAGLPARFVELARSGVGVGTVLLTLLTLALYRGLYGSGRAAARADHVTVGADGVTIRRDGPPVFIAFDAIRDIGREDARILLDLRSEVTLPLEPGRGSTGLEERIRSAWQARPGDATRDLTALDRRGRTGTAWAQQMGELGGQGGYRGARFELGELVDLAGNTNLSPERRVGAALAASATGDGEVRRRLRIAAASTADDDLRDALELAAEREVDDVLLARAQTRWSVAHPHADD